MLKSIRLLFVAVSILAIATGIFAQDSMAKYKYKWEKNKNASYYLVIIEQYNKRFLFKAYKNFIFFKDKPSRIGVWTYDKYERPIERPEITQVNLMLQRKKRKKARKEKRRVEQEKQDIVEVKRDPTPEELAELKAIEELEKEAEMAFKGSPFRIFAFNLGVGSESITSNAGSSNFSGSAIVAPIEINTTFHGPSFNTPSKYGAHIGFRSHSFQIAQEIDQNNATETEEVSISRIRAHFSGQYYYFSQASSELTFELGWSLIQSATLTRTEENSSNVNLEQRNFFGPILLSQYKVSVNDVMKYGLEIELVPMVTDPSVNFLRFGITNTLDYKIFDLVIAQGGLLYQSESLSFDTDCTTNAECNKNGDLSSSTIALFGGLGIKF